MHTDFSSCNESFSLDREMARKMCLVLALVLDKIRLTTPPNALGSEPTNGRQTFWTVLNSSARCGSKISTRVAGVDEAGRGPLAGPVVAAAAILPAKWAETGLPRELEGLNDSKQLTEMQREKFFAFHHRLRRNRIRRRPSGRRRRLMRSTSCGPRTAR